MYLLDSNICIYIIKEQPPQVIEKFRQFQPQQIKLSTVSICELAFGVEKSGLIKNKVALEKFVKPFAIEPFDQACIWHYARLRNELQAKGQVIGSLDMLIAAHALALDATLVTNNVKEFDRVPNLRVENWI
ncbi:type II toxin-antitoxin system VapC family toxin [Psychrobacter arenosus]|uniref:type II toxin-antitoxin system tRNA(fMet)-specific endonuclease VapC n=1 Tax=Psychrobacter arenosus TaxID=256326 RepID=UPI00191B87AE|nr:type II toxin-antitoxin system VapC family toxin [Psychrobacter arenosus]